jgi:dUTP pyrophosphatase
MYLMELKIKKLVDDLAVIETAHPGEWCDLRAAEDITLTAGEYHRIRLGIAVELPEGYEAIIAPRSSTFERWAIMPANAIGVIDHLYSGDNDEWSFPVVAAYDTRIHKNDRICQFRIQKQQPAFDIHYVDHLGNEDRGGFGSTGAK